MLLLALLILGVSAPPLRPSVNEVLDVQKTSIALAGIDNFIAWNVGRPGGFQGDPSLTGWLYGNSERIKDTLEHFNTTSADLDYLIDRVSTFVKSPTAFQSCDNYLANGVFKQHLNEQLSLIKRSLWTLNQVRRVLHNTGFANRTFYELSPTELAKLFGPLPYKVAGHIYYAAGSLRNTEEDSDVDAVCNDLQQNKLNLGNKGYLLSLGEYNSASGNAVGYRFLDMAKADWDPDDYEEYRQYSRDLTNFEKLTRMTGDVIRLASLPIKDFYEAYPSQTEKIKDTFRRFTGDQTPLIAMSNLILPIRLASLYFPLVATLANILIIICLLGNGSRAGEVDSEERPRLGLGIKQFLFFATPLAASLLLCFINIRWHDNPFVMMNLAGFGAQPEQPLSAFIAHELEIKDPAKDFAMCMTFFFIQLFSFALVVNFWIVSERRALPTSDGL